VIVAGLTAATILAGAITWAAVTYTDNSRSDPPPRASVARVNRILAQESRDVTAALRAVQQATEQQARTNADNALGLCELYRPQEANALARVAKDPTDAAARADAALYGQFRIKYCGQALAAPAP